MKIALILVRHPASRESPIMPAVVDLLDEWGAKVTVIRPEEGVTDLARVWVEHDLYVLKSGTERALSFAGALDAAGATLLNPYLPSAIARDKVVTNRVLQRAGVPIPDTFISSTAEQLAPLLRQGPLILKPVRGSQGRGIRVVLDPSQLSGTPDDGLPVLAQRFHEPDGLDRKIYCIGSHIFGVERVWPPRTYADKLGKPFTVTAELRSIAEKCGRALGIGIYGLDIVVSQGRPWVVDLSSFPGFKGVPDAALRLADYIYAAACRVLDGKPLHESPQSAAVA